MVPARKRAITPRTLTRGTTLGYASKDQYNGSYIPTLYSIRRRRDGSQQSGRSIGMEKKRRSRRIRERRGRRNRNLEGRFGRGCFGNGSCDPVERVSALAARRLSIGESRDGSAFSLFSASVVQYSKTYLQWTDPRPDLVL